MQKILLTLFLCLVGLTSGIAQSINGNEKWDDRFALPGVSGGNPAINAVVTDSSGNTYIGGVFSFAENIPAASIAKWDGAKWQACGHGIHGKVNCLVAVGDDIYAGGNFDSAGTAGTSGIAKWNGNAWDTLASLSWATEIKSIKAYNGKLYVAGDFTMILGTDTAYSVAEYDLATGTWSKMGGGMKYGSISQIEAIGGFVYACGNFITVDGKPIQRLAKWDIVNSKWSAMVSQINHPFKISSAINISSVHAVGNTLYIGGSFDSINGILANNIAKYNTVANTWSAIGPGIPNNYLQITSIATDGANIYIAPGIMKWDGTTWSALATFDLHVTGQVSSVNILYTTGNHLFIGGAFSDCFIGNDYTFTNEHLASNGICDYNLNTGHLSMYHTTKTMGLNAGISQLAGTGNALYALGAFTHAGNIRVNGIAHWDGTKWDSLGGGFGYGTAGASIVANSNFVYVMTYYSSGFPKGGMPAGLNRWDISKKTWTLINPATISNGFLFLDHKGIVYKAGTNLAYLDSMTNNWVTLGTAGTGAINTIAMDDSDNIYVGGTMGSVNGVTVGGLAKWTRNTNTWSDMGILLSHASNAGYPGIVNTIFITGSKIFVGGHFSYMVYNSAKINVNNIVLYDRLSNTWRSISDPLIDGYINGVSVSNIGSITGSEKTIFTGGYIVNKNNIGFNIASWDTLTRKWSYMGDGYINKTTSSSSVSSLLMSQSKLYVGAAAQFAGNKPSFNFAIWDSTNAVPAAPSNLTLAATHKKAAPGQNALSWADNSYNENGFGIERSTDNGNNWSNISNVGANITNFIDTGLNTTLTYMYRVYSYNGAGKSGYSNIVTGGPTGVGNNAKTDYMLLYPNPSTGEVYLKCNGNSLNQAIVKIYNMEGVEVYRKQVPVHAGSIKILDNNMIPDGIYFLSLEDGKNMIIQKLILQR